MNGTHIASTGRTNPERVGGLSLGVVLEILRNRRRRLVLEYLAEEGPAGYDDVVDYVVREESGLGHSEKERKRVYVALHQNHIPRMEDAGVVQFDEPTKTILSGEEFESVYAALGRLREEATRPNGEVRPPWRRLSDLLNAADN